VAAIARAAPSVTPAVASAHPFETDAHDHAETPLAAYADIEPFLHYLSLRLKSNKAKLRLFDPYFCEGSAVKHLHSLGFQRVHNVNEDFYANVARGTTPAFDVLITNPPFSGDHMSRFLEYASTLQQPWFALMPQFVANKKYYHSFRHACVAGGRQPPFFVGPTGRAYTFTAPSTAPDGSSALVADVKGRRLLPDGVRVFAGSCLFRCCWARKGRAWGRVRKHSPWLFFVNVQASFNAFGSAALGPAATSCWLGGGAGTPGSRASHVPSPRRTRQACRSWSWRPSPRRPSAGGARRCAGCTTGCHGRPGTGRTVARKLVAAAVQRPHPLLLPAVGSLAVEGQSPAAASPAIHLSAVVMPEC